MPRILGVVKEWFEEGIGGIRWETRVEERGSEKILVAVMPGFPLAINVFFLRESSIVRLLANTNILAGSLGRQGRDVCWFLLRLNCIPLVKSYAGRNGEIFLVVDLSSKSLGKREFADSVLFLVAATLYLYTRVEGREEVREAARQLAKLLSETTGFWARIKGLTGGSGEDVLEKIAESLGGGDVD